MASDVFAEKPIHVKDAIKLVPSGLPRKNTCIGNFVPLGSEVAIWCSIVTAWLDYQKKVVGDERLPDAEERRLLAALIVFSTGLEGVSKFNVRVEVGRSLLQCYDDSGNE